MKRRKSEERRVRIRSGQSRTVLAPGSSSSSPSNHPSRLVTVKAKVTSRKKNVKSQSLSSAWTPHFLPHSRPAVYSTPGVCQYSSRSAKREVADICTDVPAPHKTRTLTEDREEGGAGGGRLTPNIDISLPSRVAPSTHTTLWTCSRYIAYTCIESSRRGGRHVDT